MQCLLVISLSCCHFSQMNVQKWFTSFRSFYFTHGSMIFWSNARDPSVRVGLCGVRENHAVKWSNSYEVNTNTWRKSLLSNDMTYKWLFDTHKADSEVSWLMSHYFFRFIDSTVCSLFSVMCWDLPPHLYWWSLVTFICIGCGKSIVHVCIL